MLMKHLNWPVNFNRNNMREDLLSIVDIDHDALIPKYQQLIDGIMDGVERGDIRQNDTLPSLHEFCSRLEVSKNTVEKAYKKLKQRGIIGSIKGKCHFIKKKREL